ncbi:uncharacterized protein LOC119406731 [Rhipicephalus sanguineus]|uniref:uncharacterized protein LOC119406731 n=1 Tax=Rhipicephalus sanguineus TaxID=34632 RepID=UPI00189491F8|nr:uncharacterized protein LOC119406731 [Rhipicephalus sanguineus]
MDALLRTVACILMLTYYPARTAQKSSLRAKESEAFDLCEEKFKVVQMAKGARLGAKMLDSCAMMLISRYGPKAIGIQRAAVKICMGFRMCHAKYADIKVSDKEAFREKMPKCVVDMSVLSFKLNPVRDSWNNGECVNHYCFGAEIARLTQQDSILQRLYKTVQMAQWRNSLEMTSFLTDDERPH